MEILTSLNKHEIVKNLEVIHFKNVSNAFHLKLKITLINNTILFSNEFISEFSRKYSYHWQTNFDELIMRWDNAPHHMDVATFPFHIHISDSITESKEIDLIEVLNFIKTKI